MNSNLLTTLTLNRNLGLGNQNADFTVSSTSSWYSIKATQIAGSTTGTCTSILYGNGREIYRNEDHNCGVYTNDVNVYAAGTYHTWGTGYVDTFRFIWL